MEEAQTNETEEIKPNVVVQEDESKETISCRLEEFEPKICRPEKTAVLFLGKETENIDDILNALDELQGTLDMDIGVLDMNDDACEALSEKYKVDREATQLLVFQNCEKLSGISLEGDYKEQIAKLKESLERHEQEQES